MGVLESGEKRVKTFGKRGAWLLKGQGKGAKEGN